MTPNGIEAIRGYYDRYARVYDVKHGVALAGQRYNFARYYEPFLRQAVPPRSRVLELGCGTGVYTRWLMEHGCSVVAMDISANILARARNRCPSASFYEGDCEDPAKTLPPEALGQPFDAIVGVNTFSYYPHKAEALQRYRSLLARGGRIVFIDMNGRCPFYRAMKWMHTNEMNEWFGEIRQSQQRTLRRLFDGTGLRLRRLTHFAFIPNGVGPTAVRVLRPVDAILGRLPGIRDLAMRVALVAEVA
jgi:ubiquinone/menaquinone biosynthesis C-methylase UbiE